MPLARIDLGVFGTGLAGIDITADVRAMRAMALGDIDGDGDCDGDLALVVGNQNQANRLYRRRLFQTARGKAGSLRVDAETNPITAIYLGSTATLPPITGVNYWWSNNGGARWFQTHPGRFVNFPAPCVQKVGVPEFCLEQDDADALSLHFRPPGSRVATAV